MSNLMLDSKFNTFDADMMARALTLAEEGRFSTTPNPHVGCVIVSNLHTTKEQPTKSPIIIGEGKHERVGLAHAEINAMEQAKANGHNLAGASVYVSLEPCAHVGRTGSCAQALVAAKIEKVIVACLDPNPLVAGKGIKILQDAGIEVAVGLMQSEAQEINKSFFFRIKYGRPFVSVKLASSLDAKTALASGESQWITSELARADVQIERAKACAILTGSGTVLHDNPQLNVRTHQLPSDIAVRFSQRQKQPLRVIIDTQNQLSSQQHKILSDGSPTLVYNTIKNPAIDNENVEQRQQNSLDVNQTNGSTKIDLLAMLKELASQEINHIWVEAGANLCGILFEKGLIDELVLYQAPMILGNNAKDLLKVNAPEFLKDATRFKISELKLVGGDIKIRASL